MRGVVDAQIASLDPMYEDFMARRPSIVQTVPEPRHGVSVYGRPRHGATDLS